jgi:hypothetical protein
VTRAGFSFRRVLRAAFTALLLASEPASATGSDGGTPATSELPLPPLPPVPSDELDEPTPEALERVESLLKGIASADDAARESARRELLEVEASWIPAVSHELDRLAERADRAAMKRTLLDIRGEARNALRAAKQVAGDKGPIETPDYLEMVVSHARPKSEAWQSLVRVLALSRACVAHAGNDAMRTLVRVYVRFDFLRIDTQLQLAKLGERAVPALIEARRHPAEKVQRWAARQLDELGKAIPGEAVQTEDQQALADVLRAYGRVKDHDAARVVISFANSERAQVREAARQGVASMGEVANWQLRDTYENIVGKRPPRAWTWERTARELFFEFDRMRMAQVYALFREGKTARERGDLDAMRVAFDKVLTRMPLFEGREEMAAGYFEYAKSAPERDAKKAMAALRRAARVSSAEEQQKRIESLLHTLRAEELAETAVIDQALIRRAIELDPENSRARELLERVARGESRRDAEASRYLIAGCIGAVALLAIGAIAWIRPRRPLVSDDAATATTRDDDEPEARAHDEPEARAHDAATTRDDGGGPDRSSSGS